MKKVWQIIDVRYLILLTVAQLMD